MIGRPVAGADLLVGESGPFHRGCGLFAVAGQVQHLAGRVMEVGGEFAFPEIHGIEGKERTTVSAACPGTVVDQRVYMSG